MSELAVPTTRELAEAKTPGEANRVRLKTEAYIEVLKRAARAGEARDADKHLVPALQLRLDAWRRWGELLGEAEHGGDTTEASNRLKDADYMARHRARRLFFDVPEDEYLAYRAKGEIDKLTLAGALRLVRAANVDEPIRVKCPTCNSVVKADKLKGGRSEPPQ